MADQHWHRRSDVVRARVRTIATKAAATLDVTLAPELNGAVAARRDPRTSAEDKNMVNNKRPLGPLALDVNQSARAAWPRSSRA